MLISDVTIFIKIDELSWKKFCFFLQEMKYISQLVQYNQNLENRKDTKWGVGNNDVWNSFLHLWIYLELGVYDI